jgi:hypothetical protein
VSKDCKENRALLALLGVTELMVATALLAWAGVLVTLALLVHAVRLAHRGLPEPLAPLVRRVPRGHKVQRGSRAHRGQWVRREMPEFQGHPAKLEWPEWQGPPAGRGSTSK